MTRILLTIKHERIKSARGLLRPADVARQIEVSAQAFASYENGLNRVPAEVLIRWCTLLKLHPSEVISEEDMRLLMQLVAVAETR